MAVANPYGEDLGTRRPLDALAETPGKIRQHVSGWSDADFESCTRLASGASAKCSCIWRRPSWR